MIKVYLFKEDPPFFNFNIGSISIGLTKRNLIYLSIIGGPPSIYLLLAILGSGNILIALSIEVIACIVGYVLSILRIDNIPIDRYIINKIIFLRKKDKKENFDKSLNFSNGKNFEDIVRNNINLLLKDN